MADMIKKPLAFLTTYKSKKAELDALEEEVKEMRKQITDYVLSKVSRDEKGNAKYTFKPFVLTVTHCKRAGLDEKAIRELFPEIAKEHETVTEYDQLRVK